MAHHVYTTDAFIIESANSVEANKVLTLFTRELGMVRAVAQGVRLQKSKLKFAVQEYSFSTVSLVRGKEVWRLTNAKPVSSLYHTYKHHPEVIHVIAQIFVLLKRLIPGEEKNEKLFEFLSKSFEYLAQLPDIKSFERIVVVNILHILGYIGQVPELEIFINPTWNSDILEAMELQAKIATREINRALRESQL